MIKCGDKFCSNPAIKVTEDGQKCKSKVFKDRLSIKGMCFFHREGLGCPECGGKTVKASSCQHCLVCGNSSCG